MKERIELGAFIEQVKRELIAAQTDEKNAKFVLQELELEVSFALDTRGVGKGKLVVVELEHELKHTKTHKVRITLAPIANTIFNIHNQLRNTRERPNSVPPFPVDNDTPKPNDSLLYGSFDPLMYQPSPFEDYLKK